MTYLNYISGIITTLLIAGCYYSESIKTSDEFRNKANSEEIRLLTVDSTKYFLQEAALLDSIIRGTGTAEKAGITKEFNGDINLSDVLYIQANESSFFGTIAVLGVVGYLAISSASILKDNADGARVNIIYPISGSASCPIIYSKANSEYIPEGEAIPISLGKKFETETTNFLSHTQAGKKEIEIRIANERPETHYINSVRLLKFNCIPGTRPVADEYNKVWPVTNPEFPLYAEDLNKHSITPTIIDNDGNYWNSDLSTAVPSGTYRDEIVVTFRNEKAQNSASLIVKAINTRISDVLFSRIYEFLGDDILDFIFAMENDPEMIALMNKLFEEAALKASVWNGNDWIYAGKIYPEATNCLLKD